MEWANSVGPKIWNAGENPGEQLAAGMNQTKKTFTRGNKRDLF